jgi:hypothetical protein
MHICCSPSSQLVPKKKQPFLHTEFAEKKQEERRESMLHDQQMPTISGGATLTVEQDGDTERKNAVAGCRNGFRRAVICY